MPTLTPTPESVAALASHPAVSALAAVFTGAGHQLLLVGGSVRDALTGDTVDDLDFATDALPGRIRELVEPLGPIWDAGQSFGTIGVSLHGEKVEITTFRSDQYDTGSRQPEVSYTSDPVADLVRRDLTINAIALDVATGELLDPFDGVGDLGRRVLRCPGDPMVTLDEDPLRQLRVVRFAARTGFAVAGDVVAAIEARRHRLGIVARERCAAELRKLLGCAPATVAAALRLARELGIVEHLAAHVPDDEVLDALASCDPIVPALSVMVYDRPAVAHALKHTLRLPHDLVDGAAALAEMAVALDVDVTHATPQLRQVVRRAGDPRQLALAGLLGAAFSRRSTDAAILAVSVLESEPQLTQPLCIDGHDLLGAGLTGRSIGTGLDAAEQALLARGQLTRDTAMAVALAAAT